MDTIIEIGTKKEKELILNELKMFKYIVEEIKLKFPIHKFIITDDFENKVNEIQNTSDYKSTRGIGQSTVTANAKIIFIDEGFIILISKNLFNSSFDSQIRYFIYFHELMHAVNSSKRPLSSESASQNTYNETSFVLYDEYYSDRYAYSLTDKCFNKPSDFWSNFIKNGFNGFIDIINDSKYYDKLKFEINNFRSFNCDIDELLKNIKPITDTISIAISHTYANLDHYPKLYNINTQDEYKFLNKKTSELFNYYKNKYNENSFNLTDGHQLICNYMTNFGIKFEDKDQGLYCNVIDI